MLFKAFLKTARIGLICSLFAVSFFSLHAQTYVLNQNFNGGIPSLWDNIDNDGQPLNPAVSFLGDAWGLVSDPDSIGIGDSCIAATSWFSSPAVADNWLISPKFAITTNNILRWDAKTPDKDYRDGYQVYVSTSNKLISTFLASTPIFDTAAEDTAWVRHELNLMSAGYSNQQIYIAFRHNANDKFILMLDNISVGQPPTGLEEIIDETSMVLFPLPANQVINVQLKGNAAAPYTIFDVNGRQVQQGELVGDDAVIEIGELPNGMYIFEVRAARISYRQKMLVFHR